MGRARAARRGSNSREGDPPPPAGPRRVEGQPRGGDSHPVLAVDFSRHGAFGRREPNCPRRVAGVESSLLDRSSGNPGIRRDVRSPPPREAASRVGRPDGGAGRGGGRFLGTLLLLAVPAAHLVPRNRAAGSSRRTVSRAGGPHPAVFGLPPQGRQEAAGRDSHRGARPSFNQRTISRPAAPRLRQAPLVAAPRIARTPRRQGSRARKPGPR